MKRFWSWLPALLLLASAPAAAIDQASTPPKFPVPFGNSAGSAYINSIPIPSQIGIKNCAASLTDGFPPLTFQSAAAGGCPPFGQDFNGILKQLSQGLQWQQAGGPIYYNSTFATGLGGYPKGAIVQSAIVPGNFWISTIDNNTADPDTGGHWAQAPFQVPTGTPIPQLNSFSLPGYVPANGRTIGNATSNATNRANSDTFLLFGLIWASCDNTQCPIYTSAGTPTTRGGDAVSDYAANKAIAVWNLNGTGLMGADSMAGSTSSNLSGVPVTSGSRTVPGSILGENFHSLTAAENGTHAHANTLNDPGHTHANTLNDPGHSHADTLNDPGHTHANTLSDPGHTHTNTLTDPGHVHAVPITDPGHTHNNIITQAQFALSSGGTGPFLYGASIGGGAGAIISTATTGITASASTHATGVSINNAAAATGVSINDVAAATGQTINNAAATTGQSINNASAGTGQTVNNVNSGSGTGHNTVALSIIVYWQIKL